MNFSAGVIFLISLVIFMGAMAVLLSYLSSILRYVSPIQEINARTFKMEHMISLLTAHVQMNEMESALNEEIHRAQQKGNSGVIYRSHDGKHSASSMDELLMKMANDPNSSINKSDLDALKRIFDNINKEDIEGDDNSWEENDDGPAN